MDLSTGHPLTAQHPGLADALTDPFIRAVWELLRRRARASTVDELAEVMQAPREPVARALARLKALGLVRPAFEPGTRRRSAFKIARERLVIVYNRDDRMQAETAQAIRSRVVEHGRSVLETARVQGASRDDEGVEVHRSMSLSRDEAVELRRRLRAVTDYIDQVESASSDRPHLCNYHMAIEVRQLKELVLPTASLHVIERGETGTDLAAGGRGKASGGGSAKVLSAREREVARMLADGQNCPEIAQSLALSVNTVRTVTKRLYAKIGVRRRAELANWLRSPGP
ncbi:MAG: helix-turn-helix transcriptional regulator [Planctomycetota bacterium]|nr:helix-turn-helix transcriptional regulator [Planctomycetota bacterium]